MPKTITQCKIAEVAVLGGEGQIGTEISLILVDERGEATHFQLNLEASQELLVGLEKCGLKVLDGSY